MEKVKEWLERYTQVESLFSNQTAVSLPKMKAVDNSEQVEQAANDLRNKLSDADNVEKKLTNELRIAQEKTKAAPQSP